MENKSPKVPKHMVDTLFYDSKISKMSNRELIEECKKELKVKYDKQGCLTRELMERLERNFEPNTEK